jgi:ribosomal protein S27AE
MSNPPTPKKAVRFAAAEDFAPDPSIPPRSRPHLIDTDTSLTTPPLSSTAPFSSLLPSSTDQRSTSSELSKRDIQSWSEGVSDSIVSKTAGPAETVTSKSSSWALDGPADVDGGEKEKDGKVIEASDKPCENCGGKVVWATKGEWLMVCGGCGEPQ